MTACSEQNLSAVRAYADQDWSVIAELAIFDSDAHHFQSVLRGLTVHVAALTATYDTILRRIKADDRTHPAHLRSYDDHVARTPTWADVTIPTDDLSAEEVANRVAELVGPY